MLIYWSRRRDARRRFAASFLCLSFAASALAAAPRLVAVGDVHGDLAAFKTILAAAGVVDSNGAWIGGDTVLVQTGDLIDRGPSMRGTLDFAMALVDEAPKHGGRVVSLLGNHEVMNMTGDLRYVVAANWAEFADAQSEKRREDAWQRVRDLRARRAKRLGQPAPPDGAEEKKAWLDAHPPGFLEHQEAFGPDGTYGRWLRARPAIAVEEQTAFLHGGISPAFSRSSIDELDRRERGELAAFDESRRLFVKNGMILDFFDLPETMEAVRGELQALAAGKTPADPELKKACERYADWNAWMVNDPDGPLWFRGYGEWTDAEVAARVPAVLAAEKVERFVVGHTPQANGRIRVRLDGAIFLIDTGMLSSHFKGGRASALEMRDGKITAIYAGEPAQVLREARPKAAGLLPLLPPGRFAEPVPAFAMAALP